MRCIVKGFLTIVVGLLGAFLVNIIYNNFSDFKFTIAFLGGAITMISVLSLLNYKTKE